LNYRKQIGIFYLNQFALIKEFWQTVLNKIFLFDFLICRNIDLSEIRCADKNGAQTI